MRSKLVTRHDASRRQHLGRTAAVTHTMEDWDGPRVLSDWAGAGEVAGLKVQAEAQGDSGAEA